MDTVLLAIIGLLFLGMGVAGFIAPERLAATVQLTTGGPAGRAEVRAVYGGFGLAIALLLGAVAIGLDDLRSGVAFAVAVALAGMATGRLAARVVEPAGGFFPSWLFFWIETLSASALLVVAL